MDRVRFFDLLGVSDSLTAAELWPRGQVRPATGVPIGETDPEDYQGLMAYLHDALSFRAVRPGASPDPADPPDTGIPPGQVGLAAEIVVKNPAVVEKLVLAQLPDIAFVLQNTPDPSDSAGYRPARLYVTQSDTGVEVVIEALPVEIQIPSTLLGLLEPENAGDAPQPDAVLTAPFEPGVHDSLAVILRDVLPSSIFCHVRVRMTQERDFIVEPAVPLSIGPCRFSGLPCRGLHDLQLVFSPTLTGEEHAAGEQALDWARHGLNPLDRLIQDAQYNGVITVRTIDLDTGRKPLKELAERLNSDLATQDQVAFVLEDVALPAWSLTGLPLPTHALFGLRRDIQAGDSIDEAFKLVNAPMIRLDDYRLMFEQLLLRTPASFDPLDQFLFLHMALLRGGDVTPPEGTSTIGVTDEWTLQFGWRFQEGRLPIVIADAEITIQGFKFGVSLKRFLEKNAEYGFQNYFQLLFDLGLKTKGTGRDAVKLRSLSGKDLELPIRDFGWNLDGLSLGGLAFPEGVQLILGKNTDVRFIVEEAGWTMDSNGARYFMVSGGITVAWFKGDTNRAPDAGAGSAAISEDKSNAGIRFHRLRWRTGGNPSAPRVLLDGISLALRLAGFELNGFGMISQYVQDGHNYNETGFGLEICFEAGANTFKIGAQLFYGDVSGPVDNFNYWLAGAQFSPIPLTASVSLVDIRALLAVNMAPNLPPPDGHDQNMRLFRWYKGNQAAVDLPSSRKLTAWLPTDDAWAFGAGLGLQVGGQNTVRIDGFFFFAKSPGETGFLLGFEVFFGKGKEPVGFGVLEYDLKRDLWHILLGISFSLADVLPDDAESPFGDLLKLTGTLYIGNEPGTVALGRLADQSTWLSLRFHNGGAIESDVLVAYCYEWVDVPEGPSGGGLIISLKGGGKFGIGKVQVYGSFGFILGVWRNESRASGLVAWLELGFRIKVFYVFNFGANVKVEFDFLGPDPTYRRILIEVRIETPWYLPDATFHFERVKDEPKTERLGVVSTPIVAAQAVEPGTQRQAPLAVTALTGDTVDAQAVFSMQQLRAFGAPSTPAGLDALVPVSVDSAIALDFKLSVDDLTSVGENTPAGAGTQAPVDPAQNDLSLICELVEIGIRRRPRFGPGASAFTVLLAPEDSRLDAPPNTPPVAESELSFLWDKDLQRAGHWDPRRLLVNASTPYSFTLRNPEADEAIVRDDPAWPCCPPRGQEPSWHQLDFSATPFGARVPPSQRFSDSSSTLRWIGNGPPAVRPGLSAPAGWHAAAANPRLHGDGPLAALHFDEPAAACEIFAFWPGHEPTEALVVEVYHGLKQIDERSFELSGSSPPAPIVLADPAGMTSIVLRLTGVKLGGEPSPQEARVNYIEFIQMRYLSLRDERVRVKAEEKCGLQEDRARTGRGKLAWLPNQEYEISVTTRVTLKHAKTEPQTAEVRQKVFFHTRGLPGLNAVARTGDELEPYVEARYPGPAPQTLYRVEPVTLAFNERFNILAPLGRPPLPGAPLERSQVLEWVLVIDKMGNGGEGERITQTAPDWIVAHRTIPLPPRPRGGVVLDPTIARSVVRRAVTRDPFRARLDNIIARPDGCAGPAAAHDSLVLIHEPVDPGAPDAAPRRWSPRSVFRANVRRKDGPFVERRPFDANDFTAFRFVNEGGPAGDPWRVTDGAMHVAGSPADSVRRLALFGDENWNHVQMYATVDPQGGAAGLAAGVAGPLAGLRAVLAVVDEAARRVRLLERRGGVTTELAGEPLPEGMAAPYMLEVLAFDERLRARVGDVIVEAPRGDARDGRLALVAQGGGLFHDLVVEPLDAYRFYFQTSRFADLSAHIASFGGGPAAIAFDVLGQNDPGAAAALLAETRADVQAVMVPGADPERRQRLFDRWLQTLLLPVAQEPARLELTRFVDGDGATHLFLLESPEPLPFSRDVSLVLTQQTLSHIPPDDFPPELLELGRAIRFRDDRLGARVTNAGLRPILGRTRRLVRCAAQGASRVFDVFAVTLDDGEPGEMILSGRLVQVIGPIPGRIPPLSPILLRLRNLRPGEFALLDAANELVVPQFIPIVQVTFEPVTLQILTDGAETRALLVPVRGSQHLPLPGGLYRFDFKLDRARFRADASDDESNYRDQAMLELRW